jgi:type III secretion system low calcium response chaperone LcrH/SycD
MTLPKESLHSFAIEEALFLLKKHPCDPKEIPGALLETEDLFVLHELAYNLYLSYDYLNGEKVFRRLVIARPYEPKFWKGLASCMQMNERYEDALLPWSILSIIDPISPVPHFHAAECLISLGELEKAKEALFAAEHLDKSETFKEKIEALKLSWNFSFGKEGVSVG